MSVTVTIHSGELKQIKRLIKNETKKGQLYGLWTHSNQPVIQYIIGDPKGDKDREVENFLWKKHALRHVGNWSTEEFNDDGPINGRPPPSFVNMAVELLEGGKIMNVKLGVIENESKLSGALETLEGDSAFRYKNPFCEQGDQKLQKRYYAPPESGILDVRDLSPKPSHEADTNKDQWYSTEEGMQLFGKIHSALQVLQFEIRPSRDTTTHDLCLSLTFQGRQFAVNFPHNFPNDSAIYIRDGHRKEAIRLTKTSSLHDEKPPNSTKEGKNIQHKDSEEDLDPAKTPQSPPTSAQGQKKDKGAEAKESLDPEEIPQLLAQEIRHLVGTSV